MSADKHTHACSPSSDCTTAQIARLNDAFRRTCGGGTLVATAGVVALGSGALPIIHEQVRNFSAFTPSNDPHGEHDFGMVHWLETKVFWKIDYYDVDMRCASPDPADPSVTVRILTIMLADEY